MLLSSAWTDRKNCQAASSDSVGSLPAQFIRSAFPRSLHPLQMFGSDSLMAASGEGRQLTNFSCMAALHTTAGSRPI
jgi:hypothetical protein